MNLSDLDALAERSGLQPQRLARRRRISRRDLCAIAAPVLAVLGVLAICGALAAILVHTAGLGGARDLSVERTAARVCAERWHGSRPLYIDHDQFSETVACGRSSDRVVLGHVEVANP